MASLYSLFRKRRYEPMWNPKVPRSAQITQEWDRLASPPNCILISAQSVADDFDRDFDLPGHSVGRDLESVTAAHPPFERIWIEFTFGDVKWAVQVRRNELCAYGGPIIDFAIRAGVDGRVTSPFMVFSFWLSDEGSIAIEKCYEESPIFMEEERREVIKNFTGPLCIAFNALSRMNCKNVELRTILEPKVVSHRSTPKVIPASIWHEIKITSVPKIRLTGTAGKVDDHREVRSHWIRGHYADYRKGAGLFGNPKLRCVFWIPEYKRGNEELGQVIPEYKMV